MNFILSSPFSVYFKFLIYILRLLYHYFLFILTRSCKNSLFLRSLACAYPYSKINLRISAMLFTPRLRTFGKVFSLIAIMACPIVLQPARINALYERTEIFSKSFKFFDINFFFFYIRNSFKAN